jgi:hypothetical protein
MSHALSGETGVILSTWSLTVVTLIGLLVQSHQTAELMAQIARLLIRKVPAPVVRRPTPARHRRTSEAGIASLWALVPVALVFTALLGAHAVAVVGIVALNVLGCLAAIAVMLGACALMLAFVFRG